MRQNLLLDGPAGVLEALLEAPEDPPWARIALVCHPHPLHGGTMRTSVVHRMARGLRRTGCATLRFNFRGVGASEGVHDQGRGELEDARFALTELIARAGQLPAVTVAAGFSFGSRIAMQLGTRDERVDRLLAVGLPLEFHDFAELASSTKDKLLIQGDRDEFGGPERFRAFAEGIPEPKHVHLVAGADHLFKRRLPELEELIAGWA